MKTNRALTAILLISLLSLAACSDSPTAPEVSVAEYGSIVIDTTPKQLEATWQLEGPDQLIMEGSGTEMLSDMAAGSYTITWGELDEYSCPAAQTMVLKVNGQMTFNGSYVEQVRTGTVIVTPDSGSESAAWLLTGPSGAMMRGFGERTLENMEMGTYTVSWANLDGYERPQASSGILGAGATLHLQGEYRQLSSIKVTVTPPHLAPGWRLQGPDGYDEVLRGAMSLSNMEPGSYKITWMDFGLYIAPPPQVALVAPGETLRLNGAYQF